MLGAIPTLSEVGVICLAAHPNDVQSCSSRVSSAVPSLSRVDRRTALANHVEYVDTVPWFCSHVCTAVIGGYEIYDQLGTHVSGAWSEYLQNVLALSIGLRAPTT